MIAETTRPWACTGAVLLTLFAALQTSPAAAQSSPAAVPETRDMIEALKPSRNRNLLVRQTPAAAVAAPAASSVAAAAEVPAQAAPNPAPGQALAPPPPVATAPAAGNPAAETSPSLSLAIQFELNSSRVRPESGPVLGNLVAALTSTELKGQRFVIEGHTDARGNPTANKLLSQQRADEVRLYLVALGVHPARLRAVGKGSTELANVRDPLSADNRRVRVVTLE